MNSEPVIGGGRLSTFVVFPSSGRTNHLHGRSSISSNNADLRVQCGNERVGVNDGRRRSMPAASTNSASAVNSLIRRMKRNSLDEDGTSETQTTSLFTSHVNERAAVLPGSRRHGNADDIFQSGQLKCSTSYPPQRPAQGNHSISHGSVGTLYDSIPTEFRRHSNAGDMTSTEVHRRRRLTASNSIDKSSKGCMKQRRLSLQDSSSSGRPETSTIAVAKTGNQVMRNASSGRRLSDSKLLSAESELFCERSLSDCNRVARMRVMARLVLRSPACTGPVTDAWGPIPPRRLEPLTARSIVEPGPDTTSSDFIADSSTSAVMSKDASKSDDDLGEISLNEEKDKDNDERDSLLPSTEIVQSYSDLTSPPKHERTSTTVAAAAAAAAVKERSCKPRPLIGRKARELLLFGGENVA